MPRILAHENHHHVTVRYYRIRRTFIFLVCFYSCHVVHVYVYTYANAIFGITSTIPMMAWTKHAQWATSYVLTLISRLLLAEVDGQVQSGGGR